MSSLESKCNLQKARLELLQNAFNFFEDKNPSEVTKGQIKIRLEVLDADWNKFEKDNELICEAKPEKIKDLPYITENIYCQGHEAYITSKSAMLDLLSTISSTENSNNSSINSSLNYIYKQQPILPKITLPQFAGDYQNWKPFSDLFTSLIIENSDLSDVAKMHYLKNSLTKEAAQLVSNFQVSGENFALAWEKLKSRFENKRVLINKHLDDIFKLQPIIKRSSKHLSNLLSTVSESLGSLKALGSPTDHWDHVVVYIIVNRLDPETHEAWEVRQGVSTEPPKLYELQNFMEGRCRALENIEMRSSSGMGRATCIALAKEGVTVVVTCIDEAGALETKSLMTGSDHFVLRLDVSNYRATVDVVKSIVKKYGRPPNILVNCAGICGWVNVLDETPETFQRTIDVNLKGTFFTSQAVARELISAHLPGSIINVASMTGHRGFTGMSAYASSKCGIEAVTTCMAKDLGPYNIRVNDVQPGLIETPMSAGTPQEMVNQWLSQLATKRKGQPHEVAEVIVFLASDRASYVNGAHIPVTAGV